MRGGVGSGPVRLLFLRHGDAELPPGVYPDHGTMGLSAVGRRQAEEVARALVRVGLDRIVSSPLRRAVETAEAVSRATGIDIEVDLRLAERVFPPLFGLPYAEIARRFGADVSDALQDGDSDRLSLPGVEELAECGNQVAACVADLVADRRSPVLVVFHGGPHEWLLARLLEIGAAAEHRRWFTLGKCRLSVVEFAPDGAVHRVVGLNLAPREIPGLE